MFFIIELFLICQPTVIKMRLWFQNPNKFLKQIFIYQKSSIIIKRKNLFRILDNLLKCDYIEKFSTQMSPNNCNGILNFEMNLIKDSSFQEINNLWNHNIYIILGSLTYEYQTFKPIDLFKIYSIVQHLFNTSKFNTWSA